MTAPPTTRSVTAITIHCPVDRETLDLVAAGHFAAIRDDTALAAILSIVRADNPLGDFGLYRAVVELAAGWELFVPGPAATPTLGEAGAVTASPMVILTVHIPGDAPTDAILDAFHAILAAHPWETPVIELRETRLLTRA